MIHSLFLWKKSCVTLLQHSSTGSQHLAQTVNPYQIFNSLVTSLQSNFSNFSSSCLTQHHWELKTDCSDSHLGCRLPYSGPLILWPWAGLTKPANHGWTDLQTSWCLRKCLDHVGPHVKGKQDFIRCQELGILERELWETQAIVLRSWKIFLYRHFYMYNTGIFRVSWNFNKTSYVNVSFLF